MILHVYSILKKKQSEWIQNCRIDREIQALEQCHSLSSCTSMLCLMSEKEILTKENFYKLSSFAQKNNFENKLLSFDQENSSPTGETIESFLDNQTYPNLCY